MVYYVIGLMSGSSLDGLDIAYVQLEEIRGNWQYTLLQAECIPYSRDWEHKLKHADGLHVSDFLKLHTSYGRYIGAQVQAFMRQHDLEHKVHFIASHGHTVFHEPANHTTFQVGDGASIAAVTGLPVISDLRAVDVALGGQGAPIVPIGDKLLFGQYEYLLNIGGIANMTVWQQGQPVAFDVCAANQVLNALAASQDRIMDEGGMMAASGGMLYDVFDKLNAVDYYKKPAPKSLSNEQAMASVFPVLLESSNNTYDLLHTATAHIAKQVALAVAAYPHHKEAAHMLVTGGGAFNDFLVSLLQKELTPYQVEVVVPDANVIKYKEAIVMALIGTLRWREEANVLSSVTGAGRDSINGALWMV